jgi:hypothetical protein
MGLQIPYSQIIYYNPNLKCDECCGNGKFKNPYLLMIIGSASIWCPSFGFTMIQIYCQDLPGSTVITIPGSRGTLHGMRVVPCTSIPR